MKEDKNTPLSLSRTGTWLIMARLTPMKIESLPHLGSYFGCTYGIKRSSGTTAWVPEHENWQLLETASLSQFAPVARKEVSQTRFLNLVFNFRQRGRSIVEYTREGDQPNGECPEKFRDVLGHHSIAGLDGKGKADLVQVYLRANKDAKQAVEKA